MVRVEWFSESETIMNKTEITAFILQNRATKAMAIVEILTKDDAAACLAAALQLLPGDDREPVVELIVGLADIPTIRDALAIHAPNWGGAAAREMGRRARRGDEVALSVIGAIAKADDGNGVSFAECFIDPHPATGDGDETPVGVVDIPIGIREVALFDSARILVTAVAGTPLRKWERPIRAIREGLATANGGYSQYGSAQIAWAIRGHLNNGLLFGQEAALPELLLEAAIQEEAQWPGCQYVDEIRGEIAAALKAADAAIAAALAADSGT